MEYQNFKLEIDEQGIAVFTANRPEKMNALNDLSWAEMNQFFTWVDKAESYFKKALSIKDAPEANMNLGLIALTKGDRTAAESYLSKASGSKELNEALGNLYVAQGQYDKAVSSFGDTKTNSAALAQILAKDYNKAKNTLAAIERPDAYTDYLMAVLGARTNNTSMVTSSLKNAIAKEPALAKKATSDLEFAKYFTNTDFMNIIK